MKKPCRVPMLLMALLFSIKLFSVPVLNSYPTATATIYLDFDGQLVNCAYWKVGDTFTCDPSGLTDTEIIEVYNRVAEDYRPFNINITTDEEKFLAAPLSSRIRIIITTTSSWFTGVGGVSFIGSFTWGDDTPAFVFSDRFGPGNPKMIAECCSHESGHALGLCHQSTYDSTCNLTATYNAGEGSGVASWAPIMGNSYYRNMSGWNNGPTPYGCATKQDNLSIITTQNGFGYRTDDYGDTVNTNAFPLTLSGASVDGVISTSTDRDVFSISLAENSKTHIYVNPFSVYATYQGANLDIKVSLYNASYKLVRTFDPVTTMDIAIDTTLSKGDWYIVIDGAGNGNVDDYGSLGSYSISTTATGILHIRDVVLSGLAEKNLHNLIWYIITDEPLQSVNVEVSGDATNFKTVSTGTGMDRTFIYCPVQTTDLYYRVKTISALSQVVYSNTVMLKGVSRAEKPFIVSTFIRNAIVVNATSEYSYLLSDAKGNMIARGSGHAGAGEIDTSKLPNGMYILRLSTNNQQQTERIIKQ